MNFRRITYFSALLLAAGLMPATRAQAPADAGAVIRTETKLVLVDAVVTDKKGDYVRDLTAKEFKVWEDGKEQTDQELFLWSGSVGRRTRRSAI